MKNSKIENEIDKAINFMLLMAIDRLEKSITTTDKNINGCKVFIKKPEPYKPNI